VALSIRTKIMVALVVGLGLIALATAVLMRFVHDQGVDRASEAAVQQAAAAYGAREAAEVDRLSSLLEVLVKDESLAEAFGRLDREALLAEARPMFERLRRAHGVTQWSFHQADLARGVFLRVHRPELRGDVVTREAVRRAAASGAEASGREFGRTAFAVRVVRPWDAGGRRLGYVELGTDVHVLVAGLAAATGDQIGMVLDARGLEPDAWKEATGRSPGRTERPELAVVTRSTEDPTLLAGLDRAEHLPGRPTLLERQRAGERTFARGIFPLRSGKGELAGAVVIRHEITPLLEGVDELRGRVILLVVLLAAGLAALVIFLLESLVFERVGRMTKVMEGLPDRLARGEYGPVDLGPPSDDEIGRFEAFLQKSIGAVGSFVADARRRPTWPGGRRPTDPGDL